MLTILKQCQRELEEFPLVIREDLAVNKPLKGILKFPKND